MTHESKIKCEEPFEWNVVSSDGKIVKNDNNNNIHAAIFRIPLQILRSHYIRFNVKYEMSIFTQFKNGEAEVKLSIVVHWQQFMPVSIFSKYLRKHKNKLVDTFEWGFKKYLLESANSV